MSTEEIEIPVWVAKAMLYPAIVMVFVLYAQMLEFFWSEYDLSRFIPGVRKARRRRAQEICRAIEEFSRIGDDIRCAHARFSQEGISPPKEQ